MLFNSFIFVVFAAFFYLFWQWAKKDTQVRWIFLTLASFVFYGWWDWRFLFLLLLSGLIDYVAALGIRRYQQHKGLLLTVSMMGNLGTLIAFKYLGFITETLNQLFQLGGSSFPVVTLPLVVGISFYTFQSMSYTIDVYRNRLEPTHNIFHFFAYLSLFPQLVAGPIIRASDLLPQLLSYQDPTEEERWEGTRRIVYGFFKKMVIADNLAPVINLAFSDPSLTPSMPFWWVIMTMFAFQIYCDFSGYSDIAIGLARWMGYHFPVNFNHPYVATSFQDFWQRWHISLSTWFRDYLYVPLGGNRDAQGKPSLWASSKNMWITMLISGLWHGASWTFIIWGALHATYLLIERLTHWPTRLKQVAGPLPVSLLLLTQVWVAWVFFRAESLPQALGIIHQMFDFSAMDWTPVQAINKASLALLGLIILRELWFYCRLHQASTLQPKIPRWLEPVGVGCLLALSIYFRGPGSAFIYFQF